MEWLYKRWFSNNRIITKLLKYHKNFKLKVVHSRYYYEVMFFGNKTFIKTTAKNTHLAWKNNESQMNQYIFKFIVIL